MSFPDDSVGGWYGQATGHDDEHTYSLFEFPGSLVDLPPIPHLSGPSGQSHKGMEPTVQVFYEGPEKCECCINWIEKAPPQMPESDKARYEKAAICVYKRKNHEHHASRTGGLITLIDERIVIQSRTLLDAIRPVFVNSNTVVPKQGSMKFETPFRELYFNYDKFMEVQNTLPPDEEAWKHVGLLVELVSLLLGEMTWNIQQLHSKRCITYEYLWTLFAPNVIIYNKRQGRERLFKVTSTEKIYSEYCMHQSKNKDKSSKDEVETGLRIHCQHFGFDGTNFGVATSSFAIFQFDGEKLIHKLKVYPLAFHSDPHLAERCLQRGAKVLDYQEMTHSDYQGSAREVNTGQTCLLSSRVIVDYFHFSKDNLDEIEIMEAPESFDPDKETGSNEELHGGMEIDGSQKSLVKLPHVDFFSDQRPTEDMQRLNRLYFSTYRDTLKLMDPEIPGYVLSYNKWFWLDVTKLDLIKWTTNPLSWLVLEQETKSVLSSFAQNHQENLNLDADVLAAKGSGLVILLSGPPGTGKTLTAEAIAEEARLPLYRVLAGELGSTPVSIEAKLCEILDLATKWQAVVLLDEADTFIQERRVSDRISSEIVSIFLRRLEYFRGILFLTTNRADDVDTALRSRCRLHIVYEKLSTKDRKEVWNIQFLKAGLVDGSRKTKSGSKPVRLRLEEEDWKALVAWELSGRDIHNVVENAILWCTVQGVDVTLDRLEAAIRVTAPLTTNPDADQRTEHSSYGRAAKRARSD